MRTCNSRKALYMLEVIMVILFSSLTGAETQIRLAVVNITETTGLSQQAGIIADNFVGALAKSEAFALAEREELDLVMREQKIDASQLDNPESAGRIGKLMSCEYVLLLSLTYDNSPVASVRIIEVPTSKIVFSSTEIADTSDTSSINAAGSKLANDVLEVLAGEYAVITEVGDKKVTINRGSSSGVRNGNFYRVYMGTSRNNVNLAVIRVKDVRSGFSTAEIMKNGGYISALRRTDKIEAISQKEAKALIARKKFARKRPGEKQGEELVQVSENKLLEPLKMISNDLFVRLYTSFDILAKQLPANFNIENLNKYNYKSEALLKWGESFFDLGQNIVKAKSGILFDTQGITRLSGEYGGPSKQDFAKILDLIGNIMSSLATPFFTVAAERGNAEAQSNLGAMYYFGYSYIYDIMLEYKHNQGSLPNTVEELVGKLAILKPDYTKAAELFHKAAKQGNIDAQGSLGYMYCEGLGVKQDYNRALKLLTQSAARGNIESQCTLGTMYFKGLGVKQDYNKAEDFFSKAAAKNNATAQCTLGYMYLNSLGVRQNYAKAFDFLSRAATQNYPQAYSGLAYMYLNGLRVPKDVRKAIELFRKAAALGDESAENSLKELGVR